MALLPFDAPCILINSLARLAAEQVSSGRKPQVQALSGIFDAALRGHRNTCFKHDT
jgi:hypothetical protein